MLYTVLDEFCDILFHFITVSASVLSWLPSHLTVWQIEMGVHCPQLSPRLVFYLVLTARKCNNVNNVVHKL